ncbi:hypothetical protein [Phaffia rhodozyma]|uniref:Uncharacterized protein n=1 Tax=Phaffia rhodozyma TaxID=264483 RepID=A0A0F7SKE5_PHARH|nr:hypothetical protein [Phaffia rhodozyma]
MTSNARSLADYHHPSFSNSLNMNPGSGYRLVFRSSGLPIRTHLILCSKRQVGHLPASSLSSIEGTTSTNKSSPESAISTSSPTNTLSANPLSRADQLPEESVKRSRRHTRDYTQKQDVEHPKQSEDSKKNKRDKRRGTLTGHALRLRTKTPTSEIKPLYNASSKNFFNYVSVAQYQQPSPSTRPSVVPDGSTTDSLDSLPWRLDRESFSVADSPRKNSKRAVADWPIKTHPGIYRPLNIAYAFHNKPWRLSLSAFISPKEDNIPDNYKVKPEIGRVMMLSNRSLSSKMGALRHFGWELVENRTKMRKTIEGLTDPQKQQWMGLSESRIRTLVVQWLSLIGQDRKHDPDEVVFEGSTLVVSLQTHEARTKPAPLKAASDQSPTMATRGVKPIRSLTASSAEISESPNPFPDRTPGITPSDIALAWSIEAFMKDLGALGSKPPARLQTQPFEWTE